MFSRHEKNLYLVAYQQRMATAPEAISHFCDDRLPVEERQRLTLWLRDLDSDSMQSLQIKYSMSVPNYEALSALAAVPASLWLSAGAGSGYFEAIFTAATGIAVLSFDQLVYPAHALFAEVIQAGPELLRAYPGQTALLLAWPDISESSEFGRQCVENFNGR